VVRRDHPAALVRDALQVVELLEPVGERGRSEHDRHRVDVSALVEGAEG
jgi:hypothetical protein